MSETMERLRAHVAESVAKSGSGAVLVSAATVHDLFAVYDAERAAREAAELRAEMRERSLNFQAARAEQAEAALEALLGKVEALADRWMRQADHHETWRSEAIMGFDQEMAAYHADLSVVSSQHSHELRALVGEARGEGEAT